MGATATTRAELDGAEFSGDFMRASSVALLDRQVAGPIETSGGVADALGWELASQLAGTVDHPAIAREVRLALSDLRGSVSAESLPEMAARLAHHRLTGGDLAR